MLVVRTGTTLRMRSWSRIESCLWQWSSRACQQNDTHLLNLASILSLASFLVVFDGRMMLTMWKSLGT